MKTPKTTTDASSFGGISFWLEHHATKRGDNDWHMIIHADGNRPQFEGVGETKGDAFYNLRNAVSKWASEIHKKGLAVAETETK